MVLRLLIGEPKLQAERAWQSIVETRSTGGDVYVSDLVVSEAYFALQYHYRVPKKEALRQLGALFESKGVVSAGCAAEVLGPGLQAAKPGFVDRMIHAGYVRELDTMLTFERAARKLARTRVLKV